jgi:Fur family ferric uptake transcriptional regulator
MIKVKSVLRASGSRQGESPSGRSEREVFHDCLRRKGLKRTSQRDLILDVFLASEKHVTSEDLYRKVRERDPSIGFTTVYRTLKLLTECGLAREAQFGDGYTRYEPNLSQGHHDHLICVECGELTEFYSEQLEDIQEEVIRRHGFRMIDHSLRIWGICKNCRKQARAKAIRT